jgi:hypothetical protein
VFLSGRNLTTVHVMPYSDVSTYHVLWSDAVLIEAGAIGQTLEPIAEAKEPVAKKAAAKKTAAKKAPAKRAAKSATAADEKKPVAKKAAAKKTAAKKEK